MGATGKKKPTGEGWLFQGLVGWGLLKDALKPALTNGFGFYKSNLYPHLYPRFTFDTH